MTSLCLGMEIGALSKKPTQMPREELTPKTNACTELDGRLLLLVQVECPTSLLRSVVLCLGHSRGELFAAVAALKLADQSRPLELVTDCMCVVLGVQRASALKGKRHKGPLA